MCPGKPSNVKNTDCSFKSGLNIRIISFNRLIESISVFVSKMVVYLYYKIRKFKLVWLYHFKHLPQSSVLTIINATLS